MSSNKGAKTFVEITNKDIWDKLCSVENHVIHTNGKVKVNRWIATTAMTGIFALAGILFTTI